MSTNPLPPMPNTKIRTFTCVECCATYSIKSAKALHRGGVVCEHCIEGDPASDTEVPDLQKMIQTVGTLIEDGVRMGVSYKNRRDGYVPYVAIGSETITDPEVVDLFQTLRSLVIDPETVKE